MSFVLLLSTFLQEEKNDSSAVSHPVTNNAETKSESTKLPVVSVASAIVPPSSKAVLLSESMDLISEMF